MPVDKLETNLKQFKGILIRNLSLLQENDYVRYRQVRDLFMFLPRMWKISTAHCLKIFRGHRDTVLTIRVLGDLMISGGKDNACKGELDS